MNPIAPFQRTSNRKQRKRVALRSHRELRLERLESRLALAGQISALAHVRYQGVTDTDSQRDSRIAVAEATAVENTTTSFAIGTSFRRLQALSQAGGSSVDPAANSFFAESSALVTSASQWIVRGGSIGQSATINVSVTANGILRAAPDEGSAGATSRSRARINLREGQNDLINSAAELNHDDLQIGSNWSPGRNSEGDYSLRFTDSLSFSVDVGVPFIVSALLETSALVDPISGVVANANFSGVGGLLYSIDTTLPGAKVVEFRAVDDSDRDGILDVVEDGGAFQGDIDGNATPDRLQAGAATLTDANGNYVSLRLEDEMGNPIDGSTFFEYVGPSSRPLNHANVIGPFDVVVSGLGSTRDVFLRITPHTVTETPTNYYHFGPEPADANPHWFDFPFDGDVGAVITPGRSDVLIELTDGHVPGDSLSFPDTALHFSAALVYGNSVNLVPWNGDTDMDGITDDLEDQAHADADGNRDGTPDRLQGNVVSFLDAQDESVTLELTNARTATTQFANVRPISRPTPERMYRDAVFEGQIVNATPEVSHNILIHRLATGYLYYGAEPIAPYDHWFELPFDGRVGAERNNWRMSVGLVDNEIGDRDATPNTISFSGAVGILNRLQIQQFAEAYLDANQNGVRDEGELPLAGQPIYVDQNQNRMADPEDPVTFTDSAGLARITGLELETYAIGQITTPGMLQTQPGLFHAPTDTGDLGSARSATIADLNDDGFPDLIVPNDNITIVLLNRGDGSFVESDRLSRAQGFDESAAVGYFNADGFLDIAVTHTLADRVGIWFGNGDGTFARDELYDVDGAPDVSASPYMVRAGDVSGDGNEDLVVVNAAGFISLFFGQTDGSFLGPQMISTGDLAGNRDLAIADLDADHDLDIVVTNSFEDVLTILYNDGPTSTPEQTASFMTSTLPLSGGSVVVGQFNTGAIGGDQFVDLAIGQGGNVLLLHGNAAGQFDPSRGRTVIVEDGTSGLATVDFDRDGRLDLVAVGAQSDKLTLLKQGEATSNFVLESTLIPVQIMDVGEFPLDVHAEDLDGDSFPDLVVAANGAHTVDVLRGNPFQQHIVHMAERPLGRNPNVSFGVFPVESGVIEGRVWTDLDGDGTRDVNAPGCEDCAEPFRRGVTVYLDQNQNGRLDMLTDAFVQTDEHGRYRFEALPTGTYSVLVDTRLGEAQTHPANRWEISVAKNQTVRDVNFGYALAGTISGTVFHDTNSNGQIDQGEHGLGDWIVFIDENSDGELNEGEEFRSTDQNGNYAFTLPAGTYQITQAIPAGWDASSISSHAIELQQAEHRDVDFSNRGALRVHGNVWGDWNSNQIVDPGELGSSSTKLFLDSNQNQVLDPGEIFAVTDQDGQYEMSVPPGLHRIVLELHSNNIQTFPDTPYHLATVEPGRLEVPFNFGHRSLGSVIRGRVWTEYDGDFVIGPGEMGVADLRVYDDANDNGAFDPGEPSTHTDAAGNYQLERDPFAEASITRLEVGNAWLQTSPVDEAMELAFPNAGGPADIEEVIIHPGLSAVQLIDIDSTNTLNVYEVTQHRRVVLVDQITRPESGDFRNREVPGYKELDDWKQEIDSDLFVTDLTNDGHPDLILISFPRLDSIHIFYAIGNANGTYDLSPHASVLQLPDDRQTTRIDEIVASPNVDALYFSTSSHDFALSSTTGSEHGHRVFETLNYEPRHHRDRHRFPIPDANGDQAPHWMTVEDLASYDSVVRFRAADGLTLERIALLHSYHGHQFIDLDQDGDLDVLVYGATFSAAYRDVVTWLENTGAGFHRHPLTEAQFVAVGDVDQDGFPDILLNNRILLQSTAAGAGFRLGPLQFIPVEQRLYSHQIGELNDVDRDGQVDLVVDERIYFGPLVTPQETQAPHQYSFAVVPFPYRDADGIGDAVESNAPNDGDGNNDNAPDANQAHVTSLSNPIDGTYLTIESAEGTRLENVSVTTTPDPSNPPAGIQFPFGFVSFTLTGLDPGEHTTVRITAHGTATPTAYYKYGPTSTDPSDHFYPFVPGASLDCETDPTCVGARIQGNVVTLFLTDGLDGDADLTANGRIVDPGAFAVVTDRIVGDANGDGEVAFADFLMLSANYGKAVDAVWGDGDFDGNGSVDFTDFLLLSARYGQRRVTP